MFTPSDFLAASPYDASKVVVQGASVDSKGVTRIFADFSGTMELSDSPLTCMSGWWHRAFSDRSAPMDEADVSGVSRLP